MFKWCAAAAALAAVVFLALALIFAASSGVGATPAAGAAGTGGPSTLVLAGIPPAYLALYMGAAQTCPGLP